MSRIKYIGHQSELDHLSGSYPLTWSEMIDSSITSKDLRYIYNKWGLTKRQKECMTHYYLNGKTEQEIAGILRISQQAVSKHIRYAKKKARKWL